MSGGRGSESERERKRDMRGRGRGRPHRGASCRPNSEMARGNSQRQQKRGSAEDTEEPPQGCRRIRFRRRHAVMQQENRKIGLLYNPDNGSERVVGCLAMPVTR